MLYIKDVQVFSVALYIRSDNTAGLIPRGLGKSKQLVITEMHSFAFLRGRGSERSPVTGGGVGVYTGYSVCPLRSIIPSRRLSPENSIT